VFGGVMRRNQPDRPSRTSPDFWGRISSDDTCRTLWVKKGGAAELRVLCLKSKLGCADGRPRLRQLRRASTAFLNFKEQKGKGSPAGERPLPIQIIYTVISVQCKKNYGLAARN